MRLSLLVAAAAATAAGQPWSQPYGEVTTIKPPYGNVTTIKPPYTPESPQLNYTMAVPNMTRDFTMICELNPKIPLGSGPGDTQYNWISFRGGTWNATWGQGTVEQGGHDYQFVLPDLSAKATTQYLLKTDDEAPAYIEIQSDGWIKGPLAIMQELDDPAARDSVDPSTYYFRLMVTMNTNDQRYTHVNTSLWVGSARRLTGRVVYEAYIVK